MLIIGAGPGGYETAVEAAKRGMEVTLISEGPLGGTCLNEGCIPTKTMCHYAELIEQNIKAVQGERKLLEENRNMLQRQMDNLESLTTNVGSMFKETAEAAWSELGNTFLRAQSFLEDAFISAASWLDTNVWQPIKETAALAWTDISALPSEAAALISAAWTE